MVSFVPCFTRPTYVAVGFHLSHQCAFVEVLYACAIFVPDIF